MSRVPAIGRDATEDFAHTPHGRISVGAFCADVQAVAETLPATHHVINLCQDRYRFMACFFAAALRGQTTLLPARREADAIASLRATYPDARVVADTAFDDADQQLTLTPGEHGTAASPLLATDQLVALPFTSGSTGEPQPHAKTWGMLARWRQSHAGSLRETGPMGLVATVPCWHMYGLEWVMLLATSAPVTVWCGPDFFPEDVAAAIRALGSPVALVSTPFHLRHLMTSNADKPPVHTVVSATAPIEPSLVTRLERECGCRVLEIYGCTEAGTLAWRQPSSVSAWRFYDYVDLRYDNGTMTVSAPELGSDVILADRFLPQDANTWALEGRAADIVKIAGKRESLTRLNALLCSLDGVVDGVFYSPPALGLPETGRLGALVVAPGLQPRDIRAALARQIDPAFLPRPLRVVEALPRNHQSKLTQADLRSLALTRDG
ncbi:MAG: AMP-binding protein [Pseudomonadales bacterium]